MVTTTNVEELYTGDGLNDTFPITFDFVTSSQVKAKVDGVVSTDFTVVAGDVVFNTAPGSGLDVFIYRDTALLQSVDYDENASFPAETHELALDLLCMQLQELNKKLEDLTARVTVLETP